MDEQLYQEHMCEQATGKPSLGYICPVCDTIYDESQQIDKCPKCLKDLEDLQIQLKQIEWEGNEVDDIVRYYEDEGMGNSEIYSENVTKLNELDKEYHRISDEIFEIQWGLGL